MKNLIFPILFISVFVLDAFLVEAQPEYNFGVPSSITGPDKAVNTVYRYSNVKAGVDALVTIKAIVNATIDSVDRRGIGYAEAFQPSLNIFANSVGYAEFEFVFVTTGTSIPLLQAEINATSIDVDGTGPAVDPDYVIYEMDEYNFPVSSVIDYNVSGGQLSFSTAPPWTRGVNSGGNEYLNVDTTARDVMFTVIANNASSFRVRMGADNQDDVTNYRLRSLYFKKFVYTSSPLILPIELGNFSVSQTGDLAELSWTTYSEENISHFSVEKSLDGKVFFETGKVKAAGSVSRSETYSFTDESMQSADEGIIYYRLRVVDQFGKFEYSRIRPLSIHRGNNQRIFLSAYPNPVSQDFRMVIPHAWQGKKVGIKMFNSFGLVVYCRNINEAAGCETISMGSLPTGHYAVVASCGSEKESFIIIKR